ncbi:MAG: hypothetical protein ACFB03_03075 [Paracoccaceae bacterium]
MKLLLQVRRFVLKTFVPEFIWPKHIDVDGVSIRIRGEPYSFGVKRVLLRGDYELTERQLIARFVEPGMKVIEMGGSIGIVAAVLAHRIGPTGKLVSVEASDKLAAYSATWLEKNPQTKVVAGFGFPVWKVRPTLSVLGFEESNGSLGGQVSVADSDAGDGSSGLGRSNIWDLSRICEDHDIEPDVLVIDIEGSERIFFDHEPDWPDSVREVLIELHPQQLDNGDTDVREICGKIEALGFVMREDLGNTFWFSRHAA